MRNGTQQTRFQLRAQVKLRPMPVFLRHHNLPIEGVRRRVPPWSHQEVANRRSWAMVPGLLPVPAHGLGSPQSAIMRGSFSTTVSHPVRCAHAPRWTDTRSPVSTAVAPAMVVVDGASNGYREMILPLACHDGLLQRTVGVVAAQHLGQARPEVRSAAERGRRAIIDRLQRDSACSESVFSMVNWATLIVLLVGETVTGGPDFGPLLRMLLLTSQHCDASSMPLDLYRFLKAQTQM